MTNHRPRICRAMTALAAVIAFSSTPLPAQDTVPPDPADSPPAEAPAAADPLAPATRQELAPPPAPKPKVETSRTAAKRATGGATSSPARPAARRASTPAPSPTLAAAATVAPVAEPAAPAPAPAEPPPPVTAEPAAPSPAAQPAPAPATWESLMTGLASEETLPFVGGGALGLLALGGAGIVAMRRKRRHDREDFEARQQALEMIDEQPTLELDRTAEVRPAPAFARGPAPVPTAPALTPAPSMPTRGNWESRPDADFLFRRAGKDVEPPVKQD